MSRLAKINLATNLHELTLQTTFVTQSTLTSPKDRTPAATPWIGSASEFAGPIGLSPKLALNRHQLNRDDLVAKLLHMEDGVAAMEKVISHGFERQKMAKSSTAASASCTRGRKPLDRRVVSNAIRYVNQTGCQRRYLPKSFLNWKSMCTVFWRWRETRGWQRTQAVKKSTPTGACSTDESPNRRK